jgi:hypothetical protein
MERLMCNFHYLGYYCSPNLSIHQNSIQELTWNFLVTLTVVFRGSSARGCSLKRTEDAMRLKERGTKNPIHILINFNFRENKYIVMKKAISNSVFPAFLNNPRNPWLKNIYGTLYDSLFGLLCH